MVVALGESGRVSLHPGVKCLKAWQRLSICHDLGARTCLASLRGNVCCLPDLGLLVPLPGSTTLSSACDPHGDRLQGQPAASQVGFKQTSHTDGCRGSGHLRINARPFPRQQLDLRAGQSGSQII